jgi:O-antigen ligase
MLPGLLLFFVAGGLADQRQLLAFFRAVAILVAGLGTAVVATAWHAIGGTNDGVLSTLDTTFLVEPNDVCFLAVMLPAALAVSRHSRRWFDGLLAIVATLATIGASVALTSRLGLAMALLAIVLSVGFRSQRWRSAIGTGLLGMACALVVDATFGFQLLHKTIAVTWLSRLPPWLVALAMFRDAPLVGHGPRTYGVLFDDYYLPLSISNWMAPRHTPWAHSLFLETLAEQGLLGLAALLAMLVAGLGLAFDRRAKGVGEAVRASVRAGLVLLLVAAAFESSFVRLWVVIATFFWLGVAAATVPLRTPAAHEPSVRQ